MIRAKHLLAVAFHPLDRLGPQYLFLTAAGGCAVVWPPVSVQEASLLSLSLYFWVGSLIIGGILCMIGRWFGIQAVKIVGLALIMASVVTFILGQLTRWPLSAAGIMFLFSLLSFLGYRMRDARVRHDAESAVRRGGDVNRSTLATYADDSLARRQRDRGSSDWCTTPVESTEGKTGRGTELSS